MESQNQARAVVGSPTAGAEPVQMTQPRPLQPMDPKQAPADQQERGTLRGGGEACPGRFCFIIPCPIPCNFCVFPCPC
ncbi:hypothetical protein jhhlp_006988 [Lomentospora prolificans]|uniref:Uncharacterized protein n=1 Tax=Lomentospora prolificans TaxID=41688 RepID=A0A2N3N1F7_9PEZI|nr:hypothetical protein jhhlp_006988 [Lomentospora prolificans]